MLSLKPSAFLLAALMAGALLAIANVLIALLIAAYAVMQFVQLVAYARDTR